MSFSYDDQCSAPDRWQGQSICLCTPVTWIEECRAAQACHAGNRDDAAAAMIKLLDLSAQVSGFRTAAL